MFARTVSFHLKPGRAVEFRRLLDQNVIPVLWKQKGFQDEITFVVPDGTKVLAISLWDKAESATAYNSGAYTEVVKMLSKIVDGTPTVENYEVANSTFHKIASPVVA